MSASGIVLFFLAFFSLIGFPGDSGETPNVEPPEGWYYSIKGTYETAAAEYRYGDAFPIGTEDADALLIIVDKTSGEVSVILYPDTGYQEIFLFLGDFGDGTLVLVRDRIEVDSSSFPRIVDVTLLRITPEGEIVQEKILPEIMNDFHSLGGCLIARKTRNSTAAKAYGSDLEEREMPRMPEETTGTFSLFYVGEATVDGVSVPEIRISRPGRHEVVITHGTFVFAFSIVIHPEMNGLEDGGIYEEPFVITCEGGLILDGEPFVSGDSVEIPGNHTLSILGDGDYLREIGFTLLPVVENVTDGGRYADPLRIFSNATAMSLDGTPVQTGFWEGSPGWHSLLLFGTDGYAEEIRFAILPRVRGIVDGGVYPGSAAFSVSGVATLDGKEMFGESQVIGTPGEHELILWLDAERVETLRFTVEAEFSDSGEEETVFDLSWVETGLGILALAGLYLILKKK